MKHIYLILLFIFFTGCLKNVDPTSLVLKIDESELNKPSKDFPINKNFVIANVNIKQPKIFIKKGENRLSSSINLDLSAIFITKTKGHLRISGVPYFDKEKKAIYLKDILFENLEFDELKVNKSFTNNLLSNLEPVVEYIFKNVPIYEIDKSSFKGSFVKDIKIENSELLVSFGL